MQVRTLPNLVLPRLPSASPQRGVAPVPAQDEGNQLPAYIPKNRNHRPEIAEEQILASQNQLSRYASVEASGTRTSRALQTYFDIETQQDQERSQSLFGIDVTA